MTILRENSKRLLFLGILWNIFTGISMEMIRDPATLSSSQNESQIIFDVHTKLDELEGIIAETQQTLKETQKDLQQCLKDKPQLISIQESLDRLEVNTKQIEANTKSGDIVIQRRVDGSVDFYRPWADYKRGFGNSSGNFFIGLDTINKITNSRPYELLVVMEDWENDRRYARYDQFVVGTEAEKYTLKQLGKYSGSAGDALSYSLGQNFTTIDQKNDLSSDNCAIKFTGAWWYKSCHESNLNGRYLVGTTSVFAQGVVWKQFRGHYYSLKFVEMILRPT